MIYVIQSLWNESLTDALAKGAQNFLSEKDWKSEIVKVPGAWEIPVAAKWLLEKRLRFQGEVLGLVACGVVIRGETHHFDIIAEETSRALMELQISQSIPIGNALLCVYDIEQAKERVGGRHGHKGREAAEAVLSMIQLGQNKGGRP